ncbi:hypothetical protein HK098_001434 [Nowakowskiella sp. JEL0407]|nr:hypothetical protein HK098_001434 [Nowakowskiella sp. JEL0407]
MNVTGLPAPRSPPPQNSQEGLLNQNSRSNSREALYYQNQQPRSVNALQIQPVNVSRAVSQTVTELLVRIRSLSEQPQVRLEYMNVLLKVLRTIPDLHQFPYIMHILKSLRLCAIDPAKEVRANAYRVLRHIITTDKLAALASESHIDIFILKALTRDARYDLEREQALKYIRGLVDFPGGVDSISPAVMRVLIAIAEHTEDKFRNICLETICEILLRSVEKVAENGGLKTLVAALLEGPPELSEMLVICLVNVLDTEESRMYFRPTVELEMIVSCLTDVVVKGVSQEEKLYACAKAITLMLRSWTGLIYLCIDDKRVIRSIVEAISLPQEDIKKIILEMLFVIFKIDVPKWYPEFVTARGRSVSQSQPSAISEDLLSEHNSIIENPRMNLVDHYLAMVLVVFLEAGLMHALVELLTESNKQIVTTSTILIGEIIELSNRLLPLSFSTQILSLPALFRIASNFEDESKRHTATVALSCIDNLPKTKERLFPHALDEQFNPTWVARTLNVAVTSHQVNAARINRQLDQAKAKNVVASGIVMDDTAFRNLINDTQIMSGKEYMLWNWDATLELVRGFAEYPRRLDENIKLVRRLLSFYKPDNHLFSDIKRTKASASKYARVGCELLRTLIGIPEGVKFLHENQWLDQIRESLTQLNPIFASSSTVEPMFSKDRMEKTLTGDYFIMIGTLCEYEEGLRLLEKFKIFDLFYHLTELRNRDDLIKKIVTTMDYRLDGHPRVILSKVMTSGYKQARLFSTIAIRKIMQSNISDFSNWGIPLLVTQLYDPVLEVSQQAVSILDEACNDPKNLDSVIKLRPLLDHLGEHVNPLMLRFLSTSAGFHLLSEMNYVGREMGRWFEKGNELYVTKLEISLSESLADGPGKLAQNTKVDTKKTEPQTTENTETTKNSGSGYAPLHFYGELTKTSEGCKMLKQSNHFRAFAQFIKEYGLKESSGTDPRVLMRLKAVLWAVGNIGESQSGIQFLIDANIIKNIVDIAEKSKVLSIRGTCYYVLGMISRNTIGAEQLLKLGWESTDTIQGSVSRFCIPKDTNQFLSIPLWQFKGSLATNPTKIRFASTTTDPVEQEILKNIGNMTNHILANAASKTLSKMRFEYPHCFAKVEVYIGALQLLSVYHYRITARRFIQELFDRVTFTPATMDRIDEIGGLKPLAEDLSDDSKEKYNVANIPATLAITTPQNESKKEENKGVMQPKIVKKGFEIK